MSFLESKREVIIAQPIPDNIATSAVLAALHDHDRMLKLGPLVYSSKPIPILDSEPSVTDLRKTATSVQSDTTVWYRVWENVPWIGSISFTASFQNTEHGVKSTVRAPLGLHMSVVWTVIDNDPDAGTKLLKEVCHLSGNVLLMPFVASTFETTHRTMQDELFRQLSSGV